MKNKALIAVIACVAIAAAGLGAGYAVGVNKNQPTTETTTKAPATELTDTTAAVTDTTAEATSAEESTEARVDLSFANKGYWYVYDEDSKTAYAISFSGKNKVKLAYFNRENVEGDDAKYYSGDATYSVAGDTVTISGLPSDASLKTIELKVKDSKFFYKDVEVKNNDKLTIDIPFEHYNS